MPAALKITRLKWALFKVKITNLEYNQVELSRPYCKFAAVPKSLLQIPSLIEKACRFAVYGRPGVSYIDLPADFVVETAIETDLVFPGLFKPAPLSLADPNSISQALEWIKNSKSPLFILGKGAQYAHAEKEIASLVESLGVPFLATPMGKGFMADDHKQCIGAARSTALKSADLIVLFGARFL